MLGPWQSSFMPALLRRKAQSAKLPALGADTAKTSVSGLSSGAFMTVQYGVAFSASTIGQGVVAGGPYNCAWINFGGIITCMSGSPNGSASYGATQGFAMFGQIDPVSNLATQKNLHVQRLPGCDRQTVRDECHI